MKVTKWRTEGGKRIESHYQKWELMTTHTARRSFATNAFLAKVPVKLIMDITGHSSPKTFYSYIKITKEQSCHKQNNSQTYTENH